jgi:hypothetical protein
MQIIYSGWLEKEDKVMRGYKEIIRGKWDTRMEHAKEGRNVRKDTMKGS